MMAWQEVATHQGYQRTVQSGDNSRWSLAMCWELKIDHYTSRRSDHFKWPWYCDHGHERDHGIVITKLCELAITQTYREVTTCRRKRSSAEKLWCLHKVKIEPWQRDFSDLRHFANPWYNIQIRIFFFFKYKILLIHEFYILRYQYCRDWWQSDIKEQA